MKKHFPVELLEMFEAEFNHSFPLPIDQDGVEYDWKFRVAQGVGILMCSLRDVQGNKEDFEWELNQKTL